MEDDAARREAEFLALCAIYPDVEGESNGPWRVPLGVAGAELELELPLDYPSRSPPMPLLHAAIDDSLRVRLCEALTELYTGEEIVYTWVEHLRSELAGAAQGEASQADAAAGSMGVDDSSAGDETHSEGFTFVPATARYGQRERKFDASASDDAQFGVEIVSGPSFHPPKSGPSEEFQAHVARVKSMCQVNWCLATLLKDKRIARATHNMLAYRFVDERGVLVSDNDDDGESSSGSKLAALLELTGANDVLVVVSRWFGGVLLGPARFKYIASVGRGLLEETGHCAAKQANKPGGGAGGRQSKGGGSKGR